MVQAIVAAHPIDAALGVPSGQASRAAARAFAPCREIALQVRSTRCGPPEFQCAQGNCGQAYGVNGGAYCEHYLTQARCMPQWCDDADALYCGNQNLICTDSFDGVPDNAVQDCQNECSDPNVCTDPLNDWPPGHTCGPNDTRVP